VEAKTKNGGIKVESNQYGIALFATYETILVTLHIQLTALYISIITLDIIKGRLFFL